mgnify:CR=1 FL=1
MPDTTLTSAELDDNAVAKAMEAFVSNVRGQDPEWTDEYDEEITLVSPDGDGFALEYPIRDAIKAYLSLARAGLEAGKAEESMRERAATVADDMRDKFGSPTGDAYSNGLWDQGVRIATAIRALPLTTEGGKP